MWQKLKIDVANFSTNKKIKTAEIILLRQWYNNYKRTEWDNKA